MVSIKPLMNQLLGWSDIRNNKINFCFEDNKLRFKLINGSILRFRNIYVSDPDEDCVELNASSVVPLFYSPYVVILQQLCDTLALQVCPEPPDFLET